MNGEKERTEVKNETSCHEALTDGGLFCKLSRGCCRRQRVVDLGMGSLRGEEIEEEEESWGKREAMRRGQEKKKMVVFFFFFKIFLVDGFFETC